jgi:hypothetical protein
MKLSENTLTILLIIDISVMFLLLLFMLLSIKVCIIRSIINRFIYFFYALGFALFVATYYLIRGDGHIKSDGAIVVAAFTIVVCLILVKTMRDNNARKDYP